jgi:hypothetical protein
VVNKSAWRGNHDVGALAELSLLDLQGHTWYRLR